ncbi:TetR/AcrR family transcriptional regulator [Streptomyces qinzhouensis]|uniref:TetR/AcrR family transcriptional regulator n=1 Tax=Streptomyces qinzhouensis TaxID=2599401 RepID=A0A5B8J737_9ACTN|nr:TetR/AcrR family transcriptional regulator [Streptomyces qinzhouensis]QDY77036.1 TetR/AcrR family transcriptional regulator [Streptomyces qinzhouensis]
MDARTAERQVVDAALTLFGERGFQAVGMDAIRTASGVSLKRLYQLFPSKDALVEAVLRRRDEEVRAGIAAHAAAAGAVSAHDRALDVFDYLADWFAEPGFRGCSFINAYGELGGVSAGVTELARAHKAALRAHFAALVTALDGPPLLAAQLAILADGAMATAGISGTPEAAGQAKAAASTLLAAAGA